MSDPSNPPYIHMYIPGDSRVPRILGGTIFPQILVFFFVLGRIISRVHVVGVWSWDDTLIVIAWFNTLILTVLFDVGTLFGQGHHIQDVPPKLIEESFRITYGTLIAYQLALCFTKFSILVFYLRVFPARREKWLSWGTIIFVGIFSAPLVASDIFLCNPVTGGSFITDKVMCFQSTPTLIASTVLHTITDAWMILMVIPVVSTLQIPKRQKWALMGVLSLGIFVIFASIARIVSILRVSSDPDITWIIAEFDIWSVLECAIGIICACAPTIRPLLHKIFPKFMASRSGSGSRCGKTTARESVIELGSQNLRGKIGSPVPVSMERSYTFASERKLVVKQGVAVRTEEFKYTDTGSPLSPLRRNPSSSGTGGREMAVNGGRRRDSLIEGLDSMLRREG
ncbi:uncharacterized protein PAC_03969 [Phialocephala subalpina]|uniref:Rhodopsin domain-containing protein n=1 Tax=Phialocephala subalpina TaxID=576137 RepID=A0A1L7WMW0_9HELO|nr:uncharacterized protein PAC_03969 [Phialocephala subalpina]